MITRISEFKEIDLKPTNSFKLKDELNPEVWQSDEKLDPEIREKLMEIATEFIDSIHGEFKVSDIFLTGSLASYNWSEYSDFDIHIQMDLSQINDDIELVESYLDLFCKRFNKDYNITIYDYEIEIFFEHIDETHEHIHGLYSILKDKWVKKPNKKEIKEVDTKLVEKKAIDIMEQIDEIESKIDISDNEELKEEINTIWKKIKRSRKDGIHSPDGEYSIGNLVFKYLRRNEYIKKIIEIKKKIVEEKYTI
jgi:hypothetical protein